MSDTATADKWKERELGALWLNEPKGGGKKYLAGKIDGKDVILFKNKFKEEGDNKPYYHVYLSEERNESSASKSAPKQEVQEDDDVPF